MAKKTATRKTAKRKTAGKKAVRKKAAGRKSPTKADAIRKQLRKSPNASMTEIAEAAGKQFGDKVHASHVHAVKLSMDGGKKKGPRKKKAGKRAVKKKRAVKRGAARAAGADMDLIKQAASLLSRAGDAQAARQALDAAAEIASVLNK